MISRLIFRKRTFWTNLFVVEQSFGILLAHFGDQGDARDDAA